MISTTFGWSFGSKRTQTPQSELNCLGTGIILIGTLTVLSNFSALNAPLTE
jgi:hypothetical protein